MAWKKCIQHSVRKIGSSINVYIYYQVLEGVYDEGFDNNSAVWK